MSRIYASLIIIALVSVMNIAGNRLVKACLDGFITGLNAIGTAAEDKDYSIASEKAINLIEDFESQKHILELFIRRDNIANLGVNINGLYAYANEETAKDLQNEIDKARSQLEMMQHLFFRVV